MMASLLTHWHSFTIHSYAFSRFLIAVMASLFVCWSSHLRFNTTETLASEIACFFAFANSHGSVSHRVGIKCSSFVNYCGKHLRAPRPDGAKSASNCFGTEDDRRMMTVAKVRPVVTLAGSPTWKLHSPSRIVFLAFGDI